MRDILQLYGFSAAAKFRVLLPPRRTVASSGALAAAGRRPRAAGRFDSRFAERMTGRMSEWTD